MSDDPIAMAQEAFREVLDLDPALPAIFFKERTYTRGDLKAAALGLKEVVEKAGLERGAAVAWLGRNHPGMVAAELGLILAGRAICVINPHEPPPKLAAGIQKLAMPAVVAVEQDWTPELQAAATAIGALGIEMSIGEDPPVRLRPGLETVGPGPHRTVPAGTALEMITSGTTGDPKRLPVSGLRMVRGLALGVRKEAGGVEAAERSLKEPRTPKTSPLLLFAPMSHSSGIFNSLLGLLEARPIALHERFSVEAWHAAVKQYRPKVVNLVPSAILMVYDANFPKEDLASLRVIRSGTAPLDPDLKAAFEERYGMPVLSEYGASEFMGGITVWTLAEYEKHRNTKRGSVGRAKHDVEYKIVDQETHEPVKLGDRGLLVLKSTRFATHDWITTTDLVSEDEDGYIYVHGRADQAINRGGFKILPEAIAEALRKHPGVKDAGVVGAKDRKLGQVPVALVEPWPDRPAPSADELMAFAKANLIGYQVPVAFEFTDALPRTPSLKVALPAVREILKDRYEF